jgi:hypothetical protein
MRLFIDGDEVTVEELKQRLEALDCGPFDGGTFEIITLDHISNEGDMYFETERYSIYG